MQILANLLLAPLHALLSFCYNLVDTYWLAIILFTLLTKVVLLPVSIWVHKNGIKVVCLQPEMNLLKANYFGDGDRIADETAALYKREKYNPFASIIPLFVQLALLIGLVNVVYQPFSNVLPLPGPERDALVSITAEATGIDPAVSSVELSVIQAVQSGQYTAAFQSIAPDTLSGILNLNLSFGGIGLSGIPVEVGGVSLLVPLLAGAAALLLSVIQNKLNPLQAEQSTAGKIGTTAFSVGLSLFLGAFVPAGVGFYWIFSNLFTILQQYLLNALINPRKAIDYEALEKSKQALAGLESIGGKKKLFERDPNARREKADYKRFFSIANKHLVFYSEKSGFYKYFENVIEYLVSHSNVVIHYVTSDPEDAIFQRAKEQPQIRPYYIGEKKLITLMMKMDADMVVMTMPDLDCFHIKRSYVRKDIEYVYMFHWVTSTHMVIGERGLDHFNTVFCPGEQHVREIRAREAMEDLPSKNLVLTGYGLIENLTRAYQQSEHRPAGERPQILIAPSWQSENLLDLCGTQLLQSLNGAPYTVILRPHPEYIKRYPAKMQHIKGYIQELSSTNIALETDFSSNRTVYESDVVITDWSTIAYEFSFATDKPSLFIDTPPKVMNANYKKLGIVPLDISLRNEIGLSVKPGEVAAVSSLLQTLLENKQQYREKIQAARVFCMGEKESAGKLGGEYILGRLTKKKF